MCGIFETGFTYLSLKLWKLHNGIIACPRCLILSKHEKIPSLPYSDKLGIFCIILSVTFAVQHMQRMFKCGKYGDEIFPRCLFGAGQIDEQRLPARARNGA